MKSSSGVPGDDAGGAGGASGGGAAMLTAHKAALTHSQCLPDLN
jgi:hypothetical protein